MRKKVRNAFTIFPKAKLSYRTNRKMTKNTCIKVPFPPFLVPKWIFFKKRTLYWQNGRFNHLHNRPRPTCSVFHLFGLHNMGCVLTTKQSETGRKKTKAYASFLFSPVGYKSSCHILLPKHLSFHPIGQIRVISVIISPLHLFHLFARSLCSSALQGEGGLFLTRMHPLFLRLRFPTTPGTVATPTRPGLRMHPAPSPGASGTVPGSYGSQQMPPVLPNASFPVVLTLSTSDE